MGKGKKLKPSQVGEKRPLEVDLNDEKFAKPKNRNKIRNKRADEDEQYVDSSLSKKILSAARLQQKELLEEDFPTLGEGLSENYKRKINFNRDKSSDESEEEEEDLRQDESSSFYEEIIIDEDDERAIEHFMKKDGKTGPTLADIIMEKITEKQTEIETKFSDAGTLQIQEIDPRVIELYQGVKLVLQKYRNGKLPKAFKLIPKLKNWEQILYITDPISWSAASMYQATRIFASNLKDNMAQRFYNLVLLPRVRDDIAEYKRLNFHLYQALRKALYKPGGFMKGILLPLLESGTCTLREAIIIGSVIAKNSIPILHASAAMLRIAEMDYTGANSIILRIFFDKKYALPYRVIDASVFHFLRFQYDKRELPVLWHQCLLTFVQRYNAQISNEQKDALLELIKHQLHPLITDEIRKQIQTTHQMDLDN